jgi:hypothetical protein
MKTVFEAARDLEAFCAARGWKFCFIGGLALQRWAEPRVTEDADLTLLTGFSGEEIYVDALLERFVPRRPDARAFALRYRVLLLRHENGVELDIGLGAVPFEEASILRSSSWKLRRGFALQTCCAEDLIVHKTFANREQDWQDVKRVVQRQGRKLDVDLIWRELRPLVELKEEPEILAKLQRIFDEHLD